MRKEGTNMDFYLGGERISIAESDFDLEWWGKNVKIDNNVLGDPEAINTFFHELSGLKSNGFPVFFQETLKNIRQILADEDIKKMEIVIDNLRSELEMYGYKIDDGILDEVKSFCFEKILPEFLLGVYTILSVVSALTNNTYTNILNGDINEALYTDNDMQITDGVLLEFEWEERKEGETFENKRIKNNTGEPLTVIFKYKSKEKKVIIPEGMSIHGLYCGKRLCGIRGNLSYCDFNNVGHNIVFAEIGDKIYSYNISDKLKRVQGTNPATSYISDGLGDIHTLNGFRVILNQNANKKQKLYFYMSSMDVAELYTAAEQVGAITVDGSAILSTGNFEKVLSVGEGENGIVILEVDATEEKKQEYFDAITSRFGETDDTGVEFLYINGNKIKITQQGELVYEREE